MSATDPPLAVIGIGNILLRDDGVGVHVVRALRDLADRGEIALPAGTRLVDGGTLGLELLPEIDGARAVVFVDAAELGRPPGAIAPIRRDALCRADAGSRSPRTGLAGLLAIAEIAGTPPAAVSLVGIQPGTIDAGLELTDMVRAAVPAAVRATLIELDRLDVAERHQRISPARRDVMTGATS